MADMPGLIFKPKPTPWMVSRSLAKVLAPGDVLLMWRIPEGRRDDVVGGDVGAQLVGRRHDAGVGVADAGQQVAVHAARDLHEARSAG